MFIVPEEFEEFLPMRTQIKKNCPGDSYLDMKLAIPYIIPIVCGNGYIQSNEECDDSDLDDLDGCSASCEVELGYSCD